MTGAPAVARYVVRMEDYYSYAPLLRLDRPLCLVGLPGSEVGRTARAMNLLSGIPFVWLDRRVEHTAGRSVELVQREEGTEARLAHERVQIDEALGQRTPPIVALSDVTFTDRALAKRLERDTDVVLLHVDVESAAQRIRERMAKDVRKHWALTEGGQADEQLLRDRLTELERHVRHLPRVVLVRDRPPIAVAQALLAELGMKA